MQYYNNRPYNQPYYQPYFQPMPDPEAERRYKESIYKKSLRKTSNSLGVLLLLFIGLEFVLAIILSIISLSSGSIGMLKDSVFSLISNGLISCIIFFAASLIYCLCTKRSFSKLFPFEKAGAGLTAKLCVIGIAFSLMSNYVVDLVNNTFGLFGIENTGGSIDPGSQPNILLYFLTVAILPAFVEEFAFRGVVMGVLRPYSEGLAILVSSAAFALMHGNFVQLPFTFCCGLVFAFIDVKTNSMLPSIIVHFLNNGLSVLADVLISYKVIDEYYANMGYGIIFAVTGVLSFIFIRSILKEKGSDFMKLDNGDPIMPYKSKVKTVASSPAMISYTVVMLLVCVAETAGIR